MMAKRLKLGEVTISRAIHEHLRLKTVLKASARALRPQHIAKRKSKGSELYERHQTGNRCKFVMTVDEAWMYLSHCGKVSTTTYRGVDAKDGNHFVRQCEESLQKDFMIVTGFSYGGKLTIRRVENLKLILDITNKMFYYQLT